MKNIFQAGCNLSRIKSQPNMIIMIKIHDELGFTDFGQKND